MQPEQIADVIVTTVQKSIAPILARLAAVEAREPLPGPPGLPGKDGPPGANGADGTPGQDGAPGKDGIGFDDLTVDFDGERTIALKFAKDGITRTYPITLPFLRYQGVWQHDFAYVVGDIVTSGGAAWHCQKATTLRPGEAVDAWRLMVRKGRDGRDGAGNGGK